jgi:hypothetical protein
MSKQSKILLIIGIIVFVFALIVIFWPQQKVTSNKKQEKIKMIPASIVIIPTQDKTPIKSTTGAMLTILPEDEYKLSMLIYNLRNNCPIKNDYFEIKYDYKIDKFIVNIATENMETFLQWKTDTGYNFINDKYWEIIKND